MTMYYNTNKHSNPDLQLFTEKAQSQDEVIKNIIRGFNKPFSVKTIANTYACRNYPITSIRRSVNTLKKIGFIRETGNMVQGIYSRKERELEKI